MNKIFKKVISWLILITIGLAVLWDSVFSPIIEAIKKYGLLGLIASVIVICLLIITAFLLHYVISWCIDNISEQ